MNKNSKKIEKKSIKNFDKRKKSTQKHYICDTAKNLLMSSL